MKKVLNTLFVTTQGAYLNHEGESVIVRVGEEVRLRVPIHMLQSIVCFGVVSCSPPLMGLCAERGVTIAFLSENGRFLARVEGPVSGNVLLRREQYRRAEDQNRSLEIARHFVIGKVANARTVLQRIGRDHVRDEDMEPLSAVLQRLSVLLEEVRTVGDLDGLRGKEGEAANMYFSALNFGLVAQKDDFAFTLRSRRPPQDRFNALLSFLYTLLVHDARSALETVGLDPQVGYLHALRPGRPSLALDLMEEFRPFLADRLALSLINLRQVRSDGFTVSESGAVLMDDETRKTVLTTYQKRKQEEIDHPFIEEKVPVGMLLHVQAILLARFLRGDLDGYPPFLWR
jgi:CRISPR-associated protein Cas1